MRVYIDRGYGTHPVVSQRLDACNIYITHYPAVSQCLGACETDMQLVGM